MVLRVEVALCMARASRHNVPGKRGERHISSSSLARSGLPMLSK